MQYAHVQSPSVLCRLRRILSPFIFLPLIVLLLSTSGSATPAAGSPPAALIYAGWFGNTIPTPSFIRDNFAFLETQPFDGLAVYLRNPSLSVNVSTGVMTGTPMSYETMSGVMAPLVGLPFSNLRHNLGVIFGSTPPDFFDDWSVTIQNFANAAHAARDAGLKGLCFDNEQYFSPWGSYTQARYYPSRTLQQYMDQARLRGQQVMQAMTAQFPDIAVLTLHGPYLSEPGAPPSLEFPQWFNGNELLGPFFAGFMEGVGTSGCNLDGGELYTLRTAQQFADSYRWRKYDIASDSVNCAFIPPALRSFWPARSSISFGIYDRPFGGAPMDPTVARSTVANALRQADRYVWFYAEGATFLLPPSLGGASQTWVDALRLARSDAAVSVLPPAPANLRIAARTDSSVTMLWDDTSSDESGFSVERKVGSTGTWGQVWTTGANINGYGESNLAAGLSYGYRVRTMSAAGASGYSNELTVDTPPVAPLNLIAAAASASEVNLSWQDGSSNESGFEIERKTGVSGTWAAIASVGANVTAHRDVGLAAATSYVYRVRAVNSAAASAYSNESSATTSALSPPPSAPLNLRLTLLSSSSLTVVWDDTSSNETGFSVERKIGSAGAWGQVAVTGANVNGYGEGNLISGVAYYFRVRAFNTVGSSAYSNELNVNTPLVTPLNLTSAAASSSEINLSWQDGSSNESGFTIERKTGASGAWAAIASVGANSVSLRDLGLAAATSYFYRVQAVNSVAVSAYSNETSATTYVLIGPPSAPGNLRLTQLGSTSLTMVWDDRSSDETGFRIERSVNDGAWTQVWSTGANVNGYGESNLKTRWTYSYRVRAFNGAGSSGYSNTIRVGSRR